MPHMQHSTRAKDNATAPHLTLLLRRRRRRRRRQPRSPELNAFRLDDRPRAGHETRSPMSGGGRARSETKAIRADTHGSYPYSVRARAASFNPRVDGEKRRRQKKTKGEGFTIHLSQPISVTRKTCFHNSLPRSQGSPQVKTRSFTVCTSGCCFLIYKAKEFRASQPVNGQGKRDHGKGKGNKCT